MGYRRKMMMGVGKSAGSNIIALLHFDNASNSFLDEKGNTWSYTDGNYTNSTSGKFGRRLRMYASPSSKLVTLNACMYIPAEDFTIDFWLKRETGFNKSYQPSRTILNISNGGYIQICNGSTSNSIRLTCTDDDTTTTVNITSDSWVHIAIEYSFSTEVVKFYHNGVLAKTASLSFSNLNRKTVRIGSGYNSYSPLATIDELRISSGCVYNGNFTPPTEPYRL